MKDWKKVLIPPDTTIRKTIEVVDESATQIALVVDSESRLLGTVTDGDIRRGILKGLSLDSPVDEILNRDPTVASTSDSSAAILSLMRNKSLHQIPVVDEGGRVVGLQLLDDIIQGSRPTNPVVLMAGGLGSRLRPLTNECPKPLLKVGNKPIIETIIDNFVEYGFRKFYITVNYRAEMIENHLGDGSGRDVEISYVRENERMGTAGALSQLTGKFDEPLFVMNADVLTRINFNHLLNFHSEHGASATMCVREYDFQVPYGVVKIDRHRLVGIEEKPLHRFFVSAGIYVIEPEALKVIPEGEYFDMPSLFKKLLEMGRETTVFPMREYWLDIGRLDDFERANGEFMEYFE